ncbi:GNAT family N-acetyltransferase [Niveibacterium sp. COAC-50]|uniref:GNAT family N-acetyltransferase n=1 Tax=Niveibacterium sp. COAC-50 TaxID=2729384 RepID=UPI0015532406|nr:GNAT family N-acetyltransferase [Niveibacterium sp. COAC-50]
MNPLDPLPLHGTHITLRRLRAEDLAAFQSYRQDTALARYQGWQPQSDADALAFITSMAMAPIFPRAEWVQLGIAERATYELIGDIGICVSADGAHAEIGFTLSRPAQGRGFAQEALGLATQLLFQATTVAEVRGITDARNAPSIALLERVGMRRIASSDAVFKGEPCVEHTYVLSRPQGGAHSR